MCPPREPGCGAAAERSTSRRTDSGAVPPVPVRVSVREARALPRCLQAGRTRTSEGRTGAPRWRCVFSTREKEKKPLGGECCRNFKQTNLRPSRSCCLKRVSRKENPNHTGYSSLISASAEGTAFAGILLRAAGARRGGGTVFRVPRRSPCPAPLGAASRAGAERCAAGILHRGHGGGSRALLGNRNQVRLSSGEAPVCRGSRVASLSGIALPGLSPALPASLPASLRRGRAVAGAALPWCAESESPFPAAAGRDTGRRCESPPLLIPLLHPLFLREAVGPGRERLRWLLLPSPCPGLSGCCPAAGAAAGGGAGSAGGTGGQDRSPGPCRDPRSFSRKGSPRCPARCPSPVLVFPSLRHF